MITFFEYFAIVAIFMSGIIPVALGIIDTARDIWTLKESEKSQKR